MWCTRRLTFGVLVAVVPLSSGSHPAATGEAPIEDQLMATLSAGGAAMAADIDWTQRPEYSLRARIEPGTGAVDAHMTATLPVGAGASAVHLRWLPGIVAADATVRSVTVDTVEVKPDVDESLITLRLAPGHGDLVDVEIDFAYGVPLLTDSMASDDEFDWPYSWLMYRTEGVVVLGHWFPVWIPEGLSADPELAGGADIANFPAGTIRAVLDVPDGDAVLSGGMRLDAVNGDGRAVYTDGAVGVRDLGLVVMSDAEEVHRSVGDVDVVVTAPRGTAGIDDVADDAATSVATLSDAFGAYPWDELDVVAAPFTYGMEWPGMVWIGTFLFDRPALGDLGPDPSDDTVLFRTERTFTVAHEVGHLWWHALVGNDSLTTPVIDEPLAQHSGCLVLRVLTPDHADDACDVTIGGQFLELPDVPDGPADQPVDGFASGDQYVALVYGKAPVFYRALEAEFGRDETTAALAAVVEQYAFEQITTDELRVAIGTALGDPARVDALWQHWMEEAHGREDLDE